MRFDISLSFDLIECETCRQPRPAKVSCPHCGSPTLYPDEALDRRRAVVRTTRHVLDGPGVTTRIEAGPAFTEFGRWTGELLEAVRAVGTEEPRAERALRQSLERFRDLAASVESAPRPASEARAWAVLDAVSFVLRGTADAYLDALEAQAPEDASATPTRASGASMRRPPSVVPSSSRRTSGSPTGC
jgi:hypothetical protein